MADATTFHIMYDFDAPFGTPPPMTPKPTTPILTLGPRVKPRTQKAKGVKALLHVPNLLVPKPCLLVQHKSDLAKVSFVGFNMFARPCPLVPCPGFIESRVVKSAEELAKLWDTIAEVDEKGEILLMPFQNADWNLCVTSGRLTIGPGHAGATAPTEKAPAIEFPLVHLVPPKILKLCEGAAIAEGQVPHIECVLVGNSLYWVQIRSGPPVPGGVDYIPAPLTVEWVEPPIDDLLAWKDKVLRFLPGTVVHAPGHGLSSHAALHCIGAGVPFVTSFKPGIGDTLTPTPTHWDLNAIVEGIGWGIGADLRSTNTNGHGLYRDASLLVLYGLHHSPAFHGSAGFWLGAAAAAMLRIGISCGQGEFGGDGNGHNCPGKGNYNSEVLWNPKVLMKYMDAVEEMVEGFFEEGLATVGPRGYGGGVWGRCTYSLIGLDKALRAVCEAQSSETPLTPVGIAAVVGELIIALNKSVDQAHHGAWWLNRFGVHQADFSGASEGEWDLVLEVANYLRKIESSRVKQDWNQFVPLYLKTPALQVPTMEVKATMEGPDLVMDWRYRTYADVHIPIPEGKRPPAGTKILVSQEWDHTCLKVKFETPNGVTLYTESFEFEKDVRPSQRLGREERMRKVCKEALTEATAT